MALAAIGILMMSMFLAASLDLFWIFPATLCAIIAVAAVALRLPRANGGGVGNSTGGRDGRAYRRESTFFLVCAIALACVGVFAYIVQNPVAGATWLTIATLVGGIWYARL